VTTDETIYEALDKGIAEYKSKHLHISHSVPTHLSPAQAAQACGVSRWTIMRAIKSYELKASRNNRNHWIIDPDDLDAWRPSTVRTVEDAQIGAHAKSTEQLYEILVKETARADVAEALMVSVEAERDRWQAMAEKLAEAQHAKRRWPWLRKQK